jgi:hypothetical protein
MGQQADPGKGPGTSQPTKASLRELEPGEFCF